MHVQPLRCVGARRVSSQCLHFQRLGFVRPCFKGVHINLVLETSEQRERIAIVRTVLLAVHASAQVDHHWPPHIFGVILSKLLVENGWQQHGDVFQRAIVLHPKPLAVPPIYEGAHFPDAPGRWRARRRHVHGKCAHCTGRRAKFFAGHGGGRVARVQYTSWY